MVLLVFDKTGFDSLDLGVQQAIGRSGWTWKTTPKFTNFLLVVSNYGWIFYEVPKLKDGSSMVGLSFSRSVQDANPMLSLSWKLGGNSKDHMHFLSGNRGKFIELLATDCMENTCLHGVSETFSLFVCLLKIVVWSADIYDSTNMSWLNGSYKFGWFLLLLKFMLIKSFCELFSLPIHSRVAVMTYEHAGYF